MKIEIEYEPPVLTITYARVLIQAGTTVVAVTHTGAVDLPYRVSRPSTGSWIEELGGFATAEAAIAAASTYIVDLAAEAAAIQEVKRIFRGS